jgi:opacity protein-like surface antigen
MKKLSVLAALAAGLSVSAMAADWTGYIIDQNCAGKKEMLGNVACAQSCIKRGSPAVLVTDDGKIYKIADQDKVKEAAGKKVTLTGTLNEDTIKVESVKM